MIILHKKPSRTGKASYVIIDACNDYFMFFTIS